MCKTWNIKYACDHVFQFRLSTCRGTFTTQAKPTSNPKATCNSGSVLAFRSSTSCGPCQRSEIEKAMDERIMSLKAHEQDPWSPSEELIQAEAEYAGQSYLLDKRFPGQRFHKHARPEKGWRPYLRRGTLLKQEVKPEDVVERWEANKTAFGGGWDDWDEGYKTMEEELAESEAEKDDAVKEYEATAAEELKLWEMDAGLAQHEEPVGVNACTTEGDDGDDSGYESVDEENSLLVKLTSTLGSACDSENVKPTVEDVPQLQDNPKTTGLRCKAAKQSDGLEGENVNLFHCVWGWLAIAT